MKAKHILIIGSGSVGKRHARNLAALGCRISCYDPREERTAELAEETSVVHSFSDLNNALNIKELDGVVVASPTAFHSEQTIKAIEHGLPVLLEKPSSKTLAETHQMLRCMNKTTGRVLLGYTWRWWKPLSRTKQLLDEGRIGKILQVQFHMSAHLADWHPWEPYQDFFMSSTELGGGALLDESHWIDLMLWFFGKPLSLYGQVEKNSNLEIETDDNVDVILNYPDGLRITLHLDLFGRPHEKFIRFIGDKGTMVWSAEPNRISIGTSMEQQWEHEEFTCERNDMFVSVAKEFLSVLDHGSTETCRLEDGVMVMQIIEAIRKSHQEQKVVRVN